MTTLIRTATVQTTHANAQHLASLKRAGFDAITLSINPSPNLTADTVNATLNEFLRIASPVGMRLSAVALRGPIAATDRLGRRPGWWSIETATLALDVIADFNVECVTVEPPPVSISEDDLPPIGYQDALNETWQVMRALAFPAEAAGCTLAIRAPLDGCLLSPVETRDLIDSVNAAKPGVCIQADALTNVGRLDDWLATLHQRVVAVSLADIKPQTWTMLETTSPADPCVVMIEPT